MNNTWASFSDQIATAVERAATGVVQVHGRRRPAAGVVFADGLILTPAVPDDERVVVQASDGSPVDAVALGRIANMGLTVVRVEGLARHPLQAAAEPKVGSLAVAIGRTWSGNVMATLAPVSVVGGPLRTGRASSLERVIRIQQAPHGALVGGALIDASGHALGIVTSMVIRGTTVVIPAGLAWAAGSRVKTEGGTRQGFLGVSSIAVQLPSGQKAGRSQDYGLLVSHVVSGSPAESGGVLVGDLIVAFDGEPVQEPDDLVTRLRGNRLGKAVPLTVVRGTASHEVVVTVGERPRG
ncbi:MAG: S1C family serine protease [Vicinamibacterales bacterium]